MNPSFFKVALHNADSEEAKPRTSRAGCYTRQASLGCLIKVAPTQLGVQPNHVLTKYSAVSVPLLYVSRPWNAAYKATEDKRIQRDLRHVYILKAILTDKFIFSSIEVDRREYGFDIGRIFLQEMLEDPTGANEPRTPL